MPLLVIEELGIGFYCLSVYYFFRMGYVSIRDREKNRCGADPWGTARTLEWLTHSPVPFYNFAVTPHVNALDELAWRRDAGLADVMPDHYDPIHMPKNTMVPIIIGIFAFGFGFGMVWRIWWMAGGSLLAIIAMVILSSFTPEPGYTITAEEMATLEGRKHVMGIVADTHAPLPLAEERIV
jgi:cytochrome o ubiquinol oxidase subunit 1